MASVLFQAWKTRRQRTMIGFISKLHTFFPLEKESYWIENGFRWYINNMGYAPEDSRINSVQNGLLLRSDIHKAFDNYQIGINPEDGYKITVFGRDPAKVDGRTLDIVCRFLDNPDSVSPFLLSWHFKQCVLANMRGAGEPVFDFDHDHHPGTDPISDHQKSCEMELGASFHGYELTIPEAY